jgi:thioredoxin 1
MKKIGLIVTILVAVTMVVAITVKLASQEETATNTTYNNTDQAGKLSEGMVGITGTNYDEVVTNSKGVVVVDYFAPTCSYCVKYAPVFATVFEQYKDRTVFGKFDVTKDSAKVADLKIEGTPATIIFKDGKEVSRIGGYVEEVTLKAKIDAVLEVK